MGAQKDSRDGPEPAHGDKSCSVCGGDLSVLVEVQAPGHPFAQDHVFTRYFRCARCSHIQIVDD